MGKVTDLERVCNPLFLTICNYWQLACIDSPVELDDFRKNILAVLEDIRSRAMQDDTLGKEFALIEKPLIFFIDYIVREGRFSFRNNWHILARNYNELSGDEKFFDLLDESLQNPDAKNLTALFFLMLGLGFDGMYRRNQDHIQHCLELCAQNTKPDFDIFSKPIVPEPKKRLGIFARRRRPGVWLALMVTGLFMAACVTFNLITFIRSTADYRTLLTKTVSDSLPTAVSTYRPVVPREPAAVESIENVSVFVGEPDSAKEGTGGTVEPIESVSIFAGDYPLVYPEEDNSVEPGENGPVNGEGLE
ncbi:MAG: DotU family type IV/VI secretion system protein [Spirochaetaceae bacterium]|jgi:type VI protein secretion system component VasF|nr:DotU family type IV/VI secretion system protein [Spirochaetaceae bacterium]